MKAVVLSGGGSKGSYQIGAWKALRKLKISYDIITGTSVGALNGTLMVQNHYAKAVKLWKNLNMEAVFGEKVQYPSTKLEWLTLCRNKFLSKKGKKQNLDQLITRYIDLNKFYRSPTNFGLVTVDLSSKKARQLCKDEIPKDKLKDYLVASASCYPAFPMKEIDGKKFIDGGIFDNLPINLAIKLGADEIIAIDLAAPGFKQKPHKQIPITKIKPNNKLTNFLDFNETESRRNMKFGYNDTMKAFQKLYGKKFSFKTKNFQTSRNEYKSIFLYHLNSIISHKDLVQFFHLDKFNIDEFLLKTCEGIGMDFHMDETKIYSFRQFNKKLLRHANQLRKKKNSQNKTIELYDALIRKNFSYVKMKGLLTPRHLIKALYLYTLYEV